MGGSFRLATGAVAFMALVLAGVQAVAPPSVDAKAELFAAFDATFGQPREVTIDLDGFEVAAVVHKQGEAYTGTVDLGFMSMDVWIEDQEAFLRMDALSVVLGVFPEVRGHRDITRADIAEVFPQIVLTDEERRQVEAMIVPQWQHLDTTDEMWADPAATPSTVSLVSTEGGRRTYLIRNPSTGSFDGIGGVPVELDSEVRVETVEGLIVGAKGDGLSVEVRPGVADASPTRPHADAPLMALEDVAGPGDALFTRVLEQAIALATASPLTPLERLSDFGAHQERVHDATGSYTADLEVLAANGWEQQILSVARICVTPDHQQWAGFFIFPDSESIWATDSTLAEPFTSDNRPEGGIIGALVCSLS